MEKIHQIEPPAEDNAAFDTWLKSVDDARRRYVMALQRGAVDRRAELRPTWQES